VLVTVWENRREEMLTADEIAAPFAVPHLSQNSAIRAAQPCDGKIRAVGIIRPGQGGLPPRVNVAEGNLPITEDLPNR